MKRITARFFQTATGSQPVRDWLKALPDDDRVVIGRAIARVEFGWPMGMPLTRDLRDGVREVRVSVRRGKVEARVYFGIDRGTMLLLHADDDKSDQRAAISLAVARWKDYKARVSGS